MPVVHTLFKVNFSERIASTMDMIHRTPKSHGMVYIVYRYVFVLPSQTRGRSRSETLADEPETEGDDAVDAEGDDAAKLEGVDAVDTEGGDAGGTEGVECVMEDDGLGGALSSPLLLLPLGQ